jgi:hypothetical protein
LCKCRLRKTDVRKKGLERIGHVVRMDQKGTVKKILENIPEAKRRRGRPRLRWLEVVEKLCGR